MSAAAIAGAWALGLFSFGAGVIALYGLRHRDETRELWAVYASTVGIAAALLVPLALSPLVFCVVVAAAGYRCAIELAATYGVRLDGLRRAAIALAAIAATAWGASENGTATAALYMATAVLAVLSAPLYARAFGAKPAGARAALLALVFPLAAAAHLAHLANGAEGFAWVFVLYATVETQDSAAFLCGRLLGRRLLLPRLSPRKTVGGAIAGAASAMAVGSIAAHVLLDLPPGASLGLAVLVTAAGFAGDLFTSGLKRGAGVKDFPAVLRLHGGVLDIYDSTFFGAIVLSTAIYVNIILTWTY